MRNTLIFGLAVISVLLTACHPGKDTGSKPNILIVMGNDISFPHMSAYGTGWVRSPAFDSVAGDGILFMNTYTCDAESGTSRASFLTGRNIWQLGPAANNNSYFPSEYLTFFETLGSSGYITGFTGEGWGPGIARDSLGKPRSLTGAEYNNIVTVTPSTDKQLTDHTRDFSDFLDKKEDSSPFCFWYGSGEASRKFMACPDASNTSQKVQDNLKVPAFLPDNQTVRNDLLDYACEIERFDKQLSKLLRILKNHQLLENTIVIVTADNGMAFPRAKGQTYEYSNHLPMAVMWRQGIKNPGRKISDFISSADLAPTLVEAAGLNLADPLFKSIKGKSFAGIFSTGKSGYISKTRNSILMGRERNEVGREHDLGYPVRAIIKDGYLYIANYNPERWPGGNPETGYADCDASPSKSSVINLNRSGVSAEYWKLCFGKRGDEELYNIEKDPFCLNNLAADPTFNVLKRSLHDELYLGLLEQDDPRAFGKGDIFGTYPYANDSLRNFYEKYSSGKLDSKSAAWLDPADFEK